MTTKKTLLSQGLAWWGKRPITVKIASIILMGIATDTVIRQPQIWQYIPWQLIIGLIVGSTIIHYQSSPAQSKKVSEAPIAESNEAPVSTTTTPLTEPNPPVDSLQQDLTKMAKELLETPDSEHSTSDKSKKTTVDDTLNDIQARINTLLDNPQGSKTTLLPGIPVIIGTNNTLYVFENKKLTLEQQQQFDQHVNILRQKGETVRIITPIGKEVEKHTVYLAFKDQSGHTPSFELPLNFISFN